MVRSPKDDSMHLKLESCKQVDSVEQVSIELMKGNGNTLKKLRRICYSTEIFTDTDCADYLVLLAYSPAQAESLHNPEQTGMGIGLIVIAEKIKCICFKKMLLNNKSLKLVDHPTYLGNKRCQIWH